MKNDTQASDSVINAGNKNSLNFFSRRFDLLKTKISKRRSAIVSDPVEAIRAFFTFVGVAGCVYLVFMALQPRLVFTNTTATGGDMGAHVWWPAYMRDFLLPQGRIFGWTMDFYSGFPVGQYYFPVPALMVVILDVFLPYNIAFKIVTVIGSIALPLCAYVLGRSIRAPKPIPLIMAFMATAFLFFTGDPRGSNAVGSTIANFENAAFNQRIMGGPLLSAMAGEFSFSIALSFALLFLSAFYIMLRDGKYRATTAILFALMVMSHLVVAIFVAIATMVFWGSVYIARSGLYRKIGFAILSAVVSFAVTIGSIGKFFFDREFNPSLADVLFLIVLVASILSILGLAIYGWLNERELIKKIGFDSLPLLVGVLISSIWLLPLFARFSYTSNMRYEKLIDDPTTKGVNEVLALYLAPEYMYWKIFIPVAIGFILSATLLRKSIIPVLVTAVTMGLFFARWPEGHAWNLRFLPFWYLFIFFVAAVGYGELARIPSAATSYIARKNRDRGLLFVSKILALALTILLVVGFFVGLVGVGNAPKQPDGCEAPDNRFFKDNRGFADGWAKYNFEGYERKPQNNSCGDNKNDKSVYTSSIEFKNVMDEMGELPPGRALWEPHDGTYGTTIALTLLPYYTDHRIASQEGLYYEAAGSTAYHFLTVAEVSKTPSNPMRWPKCELNKDGSKKDPECLDNYYGTIADFDRGVDHMRMMGVKYFMAHSEEAKQAASQSEGLKFLKKIEDKDGLNPFGFDVYEVRRSKIVESLNYEPIVVTDKNKPSDWSQSGNKWLYDWFNSVGQYPLFVNDGPEEWTRKTADEALRSKVNSKTAKIEKVKVSKVKMTQDSVSFSVDKVGEPVLINVSYYPTFKATGAKEIYRASPNFMVVVPTEKNVKIELKRDSVEWISIILFLIGIGLCLYLGLSRKKDFKLLSRFLNQKR